MTHRIELSGLSSDKVKQLTVVKYMFMVLMMLCLKWSVFQSPLQTVIVYSLGEYCSHNITVATEDRVLSVVNQSLS